MLVTKTMLMVSLAFPVDMPCMPEIPVVQQLLQLMGMMQPVESEEAEAPVEEEEVVEEYALPSGEISAEDLLEVLEHWKEESPSLLEIFQALSDGETRTISGDAVRSAVDQAGVTLPHFIPAESLVGVEIGDGQIRVRFDESLRLKVPAKKTWVLEPGEDSDPFAVSAGATATQHKASSYNLKINEELVFDVDENGLHGIRKGDLVASKFVFSVGVSLKSIHGVDDFERIGDAYVLEIDESGEPIVVDGRYVPKKAEDWVEVTAKDVERLGVPRLGE